MRSSQRKPKAKTMAAKRVAASAIKWAEMAERVPPQQKNMFQAFKSKSDGYVQKVSSLPSELPKIDFASYRKYITVPGLVDQFEKQYASYKVPEPVDKSTAISEIDAYEKEIKTDIALFVKESNVRIAESQTKLKAIDEMWPFEYMTMEDETKYFADCDGVIDPAKPSIWPHVKSEQEEFQEYARRDRLRYGYGRH